MTRKNAFYAQSGGVTAVINASACGVLQTARQHSEEMGKVYAGRNGIIGALTEDLIDTSVESESAIAALKHTPGAAFGSCRYKLTSIREQRQQGCIAPTVRRATWQPANDSSTVTAAPNRAPGRPTVQIAQLVNSADQNRKGQADDTQACKFPEVHSGHSEYRSLIVRDFSRSGPLCFRAEGG